MVFIIGSLIIAQGHINDWRKNNNIEVTVSSLIGQSQYQC